jgi:hypothetical protein
MIQVENPIQMSWQEMQTFVQEAEGLDIGEISIYPETGTLVAQLLLKAADGTIRQRLSAASTFAPEQLPELFGGNAVLTKTLRALAMGVLQREGVVPAGEWIDDMLPEAEALPVHLPAKEA